MNQLCWWRSILYYAVTLKLFVVG